MNDAALKSDTQDIVVEEVFPHAPETVWKTLTTGELVGRWLLMTPTGFEPVKGARFTFQTKPAGAWDGVIHCEVLEVIQPAPVLFVARRSRQQQWAIWLASRHDRHPDARQGRPRHKAASRAFRLRDAEERNRIPEHEPGLEGGRWQDQRPCRVGSLTGRIWAENFKARRAMERHDDRPQDRNP